MNDQEIKLYSQPSEATKLGEYADLVAPLPKDPLRLAEIVRGLLIHDTDIDPNAPESSERLKDREIMTAEKILERILQLDSSDLAIKRPVERLMVGYCYTFTLLHTALLRAKGIPARARCGFVSYFDKGKWIDHWVTEYADNSSWRLIDAHTGRDAVSRDEFQDAGTAWLLCRSNQAEPSIYGVSQFSLWGWDELRGSVVNDFGALNKAEHGHWDWCTALDIQDKTNPNKDLDAKIDLIAEACAGEAQTDKVMQIFASEHDFHPPVEAR